MKAKIAACIGCFLTLTAQPLFGITYDLRTDWSTTQNPNGVWSYLRNGSVASEGVRGGDPFAFPTPIWGDDLSIAGWSQDDGSRQFSLDLQLGDIYGHTPATFADGSIGFLWTSPGAGMIDVSGSVWGLRPYNRVNSWLLELEGNQLANGTISGVAPYNRANPLIFGDTALAVNAGDTLMFAAAALGDGDYLGVNLTVEFTPGSVPDAGSTGGLLFTVILALLAGEVLTRMRIRA